MYIFKFIMKPKLNLLHFGENPQAHKQTLLPMLSELSLIRQLYHRFKNSWKLLLFSKSSSSCEAFCLMTHPNSSYPLGKFFLPKGRPHSPLIGFRRHDQLGMDILKGKVYLKNKSWSHSRCTGIDLPRLLYVSIIEAEAFLLVPTIEEASCKAIPLGTWIGTINV